MRRKPLLWLAAAGAVVLAGLLLARSWLLRDDTAPVSVDKVVDRYKGERTATATTALPAGVKIPAAGVYTFTTTGSERTDLIGGSEHEYPGQTTITVRPVDCGFEQTWTALDKRAEAWRYCAQDGALRPTAFHDIHSFYGRTDDRTYACSGGAIPLRADGDPATIVCRRDGVTRTDRVRAIGAERIDVGGQAVATIHVRTSTRMAGSTEGTSTYDSWLARDTGLPVRIRADVDNRSDTPIGTKVHYTERFDLRLESLTPST